MSFIFTILDSFLEKINKEKNLLEKLSEFKKILKFKNQKDLKNGLTKFTEIPFDHVFLFMFDNGDTIKIFHTIGMKFNIDIYFYDSDKKFINKKLNCPPGIKEISSIFPCKYVLECRSRE
ncbi:MAG: hypothetical protein BWY04_01068 [candidate division CPR1 bacterium ADurb.Bin160]|uniref:DUF192 domain-containing protein n=1 Tax=candidate division CPR1 bacterium ADurb.Bin160 TaxID=1852826 RepID=A0A1V5ZLV7_9BACT|nr:MAG: hypothetical protein BWY04_01068 [candidate division CPR1 bacterium ADurb.Bin160]